jgi:hypothetical protein
MDDDRKYKQRGYMDSNRESRDRPLGERPKPNDRAFPAFSRT